MGDLAQPFEMSWPAITKHVKVLERAGLVRREQDGRLHRIHLDAAPLRDVRDFVDNYRQFWEAGFDRLDTYLRERGHTRRKKRQR